MKNQIGGQGIKAIDEIPDRRTRESRRLMKNQIGGQGIMTELKKKNPDERTRESMQNWKDQI